MAVLIAVCAGVAVLCVGFAKTARAVAPWEAEAGMALRRAGSVQPRRQGVRRSLLWVRLIPSGVEAAVRRWRQEWRKGPDLLARQLAWAGLDDLITPEQFLCLWAVTPLGLFGILMALYLVDPAPFRLVLTVAGGGVGAALPAHWLRQQVRRHQQAVCRELPAVLTTLGVLIDAGLNLVPALQEVTLRRQGVLVEVLRPALRQAALGTPIQDALRAAADRCGVQEFTLFVSVLSQAMEKGAGGVSEAVRSQSQEMWKLRQQQVQEKGQEMAQDLFFVLMFLAFPAIALFLLGPVGLSLYQLFFRGVMGS